MLDLIYMTADLILTNTKIIKKKIGGLSLSLKFDYLKEFHDIREFKQYKIC